VAVALAVFALVALVLAAQALSPVLRQRTALLRARLAVEPEDEIAAYDPGRERRAEARARELLRSCVNAEEWAMYRDLGFLRVWGARNGGKAGDDAVAPYAYLIYPHKPIIAFVPQTSRLLGEYCVEFPDRERPYGSSRLPPSDDVLAKWMALSADERALIENANLHFAGRQHDPDAVRGDLAALGRWERERLAQRQRDAGSVPAP
jgi:hypothetical protein